MSAAVVVAESPDALRSLGSQVLSQLGEGVVVLGAVFGDKATVVAFCSPAAITAGYKAGKIVNELSLKLGGKGGGKPDFAMGGGRDVAKLAGGLSSRLAESLSLGQLLGRCPRRQGSPASQLDCILAFDGNNRLAVRARAPGRAWPSPGRAEPAAVGGPRRPASGATPSPVERFRAGRGRPPCRVFFTQVEGRPADPAVDFRSIEDLESDPSALEPRARGRPRAASTPT